jgi:DNA repair protein RadA/Sms
MARPTTVFTCSSCGHEEPKWHGRCAGCGEWNTLAEEIRAPVRRGGGGAARAAGPGPARPVRLADVQAVKVARLKTGIGELDRVLGGGLVPGSLVLLGGSPGIGKSTLTSMALGNLAGAGRRTLYVSGEESAAQIKLRAERLPGAALEVPVLAETDLDTVVATLDAERPEVCVVDSVQTLHAADLTGAAGSVGQVREVADRITRLAKARDIAVLLVGHVTKEGALAGPRVLEHLVDCVLQFEGERERTYRTLRALKNRFGSTNEAGVFEMRQGGLVEVQDASARFVGEATRAPGSVVLAAMEGSRPLLVEVQALVSPSELVPPRRVANGIDRNRLALVLAVLGRHAGVGVGTADVFVNVAGGVRVDEPGADLAVALAVASAARGVVAAAEGKPVTSEARQMRPIACFGEIGLTGELRSVAHPERRLAEAAKFGLTPTVAPTGAGRGASEAATLRAALRSALGAAPTARAA